MGVCMVRCAETQGLCCTSSLSTFLRSTAVVVSLHSVLHDCDLRSDTIMSGSVRKSQYKCSFQTTGQTFEVRALLSPALISSLLYRSDTCWFC